MSAKRAAYKTRSPEAKIFGHVLAERLKGLALECTCGRALLLGRNRDIERVAAKLFDEVKVAVVEIRAEDTAERKAKG